MSPSPQNVNALVLVCGDGKDFRFTPEGGQPDRWSGAVKIEHNLRRARLTSVQRNPANLIETRTDRSRLDLRRRLLYLGAACYSRQNGRCNEHI